MTWTPEAVEEVRNLALTMTAGEIAAKTGNTRNSIIGMCRRNKIELSAFDSRVHPHGRIIRAVKRKQRQESLKLKNARSVFLTVKGSHRSPTEEPQDTTHWPPPKGYCCYIIGEPRNRICCGNRVKPTKLYCLAHYQECYDLVKSQRPVK